MPNTYHYQVQPRLVVTLLGTLRSYSTSSRVSTEMGDRWLVCCGSISLSQVSLTVFRV